VGEFTIEGENLSGAVSILVEPSVAAASLFFSNLVASGSALKAALIVHGRALEGEFSLKVSTAGGVSNSMPIAIRNAPVIDLLHWPISVRGVRIANFTISGRYLSRVTNLEFVPPDGITVANVKSTATAVTADVTISSTAVFGPRRVILRTPADESNWMVFTVSEPKVALSNLTVKFHNSWNLEANADLEDASGASNSYSYLLSVKTSGPGAVSVVRMGSALAAGAGATGSDSRSSGKLTIWISGNANTQGLYIPWGGEYEVTLRVNNMSGVASNSISVKGRYPF
jgi:hypothetical protein